MEDNFVISVITPSYNQGRYLAETIESVLSQKGDFYLDYIIVDGGSTDNSVEIIKRYERLLNEGASQVKCRGIKYRWISERDRGQTDALIKGFRMAEGEILAWLNSDDLYLPCTLQTVAAFFRANPEAALLYGDAHYSDANGEIIGRYPTEDFNLVKLAYFNFICQPSTFFLKEAFGAVGGLDDSLHFAMDYDLWIRMAKKFDFKYLPDFLSTYRLHQESKTVSPKDALANHKEALDTIIKYYNWAPLNRVYGYCSQLLKSRLPEALGKFNGLIVVLSVPFVIIKYLSLNRGIRLDDLKMINRSNLRKLSMKGIDVYKEY